jgi:hypothetical protein
MSILIREIINSNGYWTYQNAKQNKPIKPSKLITMTTAYFHSINPTAAFLNQLESENRNNEFFENYRVFPWTLKLSTSFFIEDHFRNSTKLSLALVGDLKSSLSYIFLLNIFFKFN